MGPQLIEPTGDGDGLAGFITDHSVQREVGLSVLCGFGFDAAQFVLVEAGLGAQIGAGQAAVNSMSTFFTSG